LLLIELIFWQFTHQCPSSARLISRNFSSGWSSFLLSASIPRVLPCEKRLPKAYSTDSTDPTVVDGSDELDGAYRKPSARPETMQSFLNSSSEKDLYVNHKLVFSARKTVRSLRWRAEFLNRISSEVESKIIEMWCKGFSRDETARILMVGQGTVSAVWASLPPCLKSLRDLGKALRKLNLQPNDAVEGVNLLELLAKYRITPEQVPIFLETIVKASTEAGCQPEDLIQAKIKLRNLESQSGKTYPEALERFETITHQTSELQQENSQLQLETEENRRRRNEALEQARTTPQEL
jgi:hypothetical protein